MGYEIRRKFGKSLYKRRMKRGWTQQELAERADLSVRHITRLESNKPSPVTIDTLEKLAKAFKITPSKLLDI